MRITTFSRSSMSAMNLKRTTSKKRLPFLGRDTKICRIEGGGGVVTGFPLDLENLVIITGRSWARVMFLQASVILSTGGGGCLPKCISDNKIFKNMTKIPDNLS